MTLELVVARFREDVAWTRRVPPAVEVTLYDKGGDLDGAAFPRARIVRLPNVGREAHSYLHHLVSRTAGPSAPGAGAPRAGVTVFCQGRPFDHAYDFHRTLRALAAGDERVAGFRWLGHLVDTDDDRGRRLFVRWSKNEDGRELRLDAFHRALLGPSPPPLVRFYGGGQFAVTGALAAARPPEFWRRALALAETFPDAAHCFERLWDRVFGVEGVDPELLGGRDCRWLKPLRAARP